MRRDGRWRAAALGAAGMLLVGVGPTTLPVESAGAAEPQLRVLAFNICGAICNRGIVDRPGTGNDVVEHVAAVIREFRPHIAVLNEVCGPQHQRLVSLLHKAGLAAGSAFHAQRDDRRCGRGDRSFGDTVLSFGPVHGTEVHRLPNRKEDRAILCLRTTHHGRRFLACGLHLTAKAPGLHPRQVDATVRFVRDRSRSIPVLVAGDFNADPRQLRRLSDTGRGGFHADVDHTDHAVTHGGRKIDYAFLPTGTFRDLAGDVRSSRWSDHRILFGWAGLRS